MVIAKIFNKKDKSLVKFEFKSDYTNRDWNKICDFYKDHKVFELIITEI